MMKCKIVTWHAWILISISCLVPGCGILGEDDDFRNVPIEGPILFRIVEAHLLIQEEGDPEIILFMETEKIYGCMNFSINTILEFQEDTVFVELLSIDQSGECATTLGPARFNSPLPLEPGEYYLLFREAANTDIYNLVITDSSIHVHEQISEVTISEVNLAWRYPEQSFAYVCGTTEETAWICSDFYDSLMTIGTLQEFSFPDSGYIPYPDSSYGHYHDNAAVYFLYETEADFDLAGAKLEEYSAEVISQYSGVGIYLVNWRNKRYRSWSFEN